MTGLGEAQQRAELIRAALTEMNQLLATARSSSLANTGYEAVAILERENAALVERVEAAERLTNDASAPYVEDARANARASLAAVSSPTGSSVVIC